MISTKADARIESLNTYTGDEELEEELDYLFVAEQPQAYKGEFYLPLSQSEKTYWRELEGKFASVRSTAARNSLDFWIESCQVLEEGVRGEFEGRAWKNSVKLEEGDEIFRILIYGEEDLLPGPEVEARADEILSEYEITSNALKIPLKNRLKLKSAETSLQQLEEDKNRLIERAGDEDTSFRSFELLETCPISMPEDIFGRIIGTSIEGHSFHLNSVAVDPSYEGELVAEVAIPSGRQPEEPPGWYETPRYLLMELYESTDPLFDDESED